MSFILEALKKSEQQRQQQTTPAKTVRKRTLSLQASPVNRRFPWLVSGLLSLLLLCGGWYYAQTDQLQTAPQVVVEAANPAPLQAVAAPATEAKDTPPEVVRQEVTETPPVAQSAPPQVTINVEPSPVPRALGSPKTTQPVPPQRKPSVTADRKLQASDGPVETLVISQPEPQPIVEEAFNPSSTRLPLYAELSGELRGRMPAINLSMHFYNREPNRRLVRINDLLLHEGDWVARDLQLVEITGNGVTLDFLGKRFSLPRNRR